MLMVASSLSRLSICKVSSDEFLHYLLLMYYCTDMMGREGLLVRHHIALKDCETQSNGLDSLNYKAALWELVLWGKYLRGAVGVI